MKAVLDTNIFISGIFWSGLSEKILYALGDKKFELITSGDIIEEIIETLMDFRIHLSVDIILLWASILSINSVIVEPSEKLEIVTDDRDDNKFIEAAVTGKASYIVTQDNHLLKLKEFRGIKILTPKEFLDIVNL